MKLLIACTNVNGLGGSELYHYELCREIQLNHKDIDLTLLTLRPIKYTDQVRKKLTEFGVKQIDLRSLDRNTYDIILTSQPEVNQYILRTYNAPIVSIIHSEIRSEDPIINNKIKHYIAVRKTIVEHLNIKYKIPLDKISLIYNPIDTSRYNTNDIVKFEKTTGLYIGDATDYLRLPSIKHMISECIKENWDLYIMSKSVPLENCFLHSNIINVPPVWNNEQLLKKVHFTAGILLGRTTIEGYHCDIPGFIYNIDTYGNIKSITSDHPENIVSLSDSKYVTQTIIKILNEN